MATGIPYDPAGAVNLLNSSHSRDLERSLLAARQDVLDDAALLDSGTSIPPEKQPLDAGFIELPQRLLQQAEGASHTAIGSLREIEQVAAELRDRVDRVVLLGIGGSYMGARALFEGLCSPFHNELKRDERHGIPRISFEGNNLDNDSIAALSDLLEQSCRDPRDLLQRWAIVVISKSGGTLETAAAFRLFRTQLEQYYGVDSKNSRRCVVPITGAVGKLRDLANARRYPAVFPIPEGVGGRFSIFTAVGLFPAAILGLNVRRLLEGAADMTERFRTEPFGSNPVLDYTATCHLFEREHNATIRVLSTWGNRLEAVGLWYDQLLSESLGKQELGATPITAVNTRDLHSRGQQHQEGIRNKLITNLIVERPASDPIHILPVAEDQDFDQLNRFAGKSVPELLSAAFRGTNQAYAGAERPTADIILPQLDEYCLGQLFQMLMLATVVEGRLIGVNPYGQPGVEAYKQNMLRILTQ